MTWRISDGRIDRLVVFKWYRADYRPVGELRFEGASRVRAGHFLYARTWLEDAGTVPIDPIGLPLRRGPADGAPDEVPLAFYDAGPDGWGKGVLTAAFPSLPLGMAEYLALGTAQRTGDLAFGPDPEAPATWMPDAVPLPTLPVDSDRLEDLLEAATALEEGRPERRQLLLLFRSSADVGGARPKARLRHAGGEWIAKFPTWGDSFDDPRMEAVCLDLADLAGVAVPERQLLVVGARSVLLVRRFDRRPDGGRLGYLSAATLLKQPFTEYRTNRTYVDIAVAARTIGVPDPEEAVYRRLLVNAFLHNTDDHLRNMAVLNDGGRWRLAPGFDLVPHREGRHVCAPAPGVGPEHSPQTAARSYKAFGLGAGRAREIYDEVVAGMRCLGKVFDTREVTAKDRGTVMPLLAACIDPPRWQ